MPNKESYAYQGPILTSNLVDFLSYFPENLFAPEFLIRKMFIQKTVDFIQTLGKHNFPIFIDVHLKAL